jgi:hypothetical protein
MNSISNKMISTNIAAMKEAQDYLMKDEWWYVWSIKLCYERKMLCRSSSQ